MRTWIGLTLALLLALILALVLAGCGESGVVVAPVQVPTEVILRTMNGTTLANAAWVAYQDGDGSWRVIEKKSTGVYREEVSDPAGRYGLAIVSPGAQPVITLYQGTLAEMSTITHVFAPFVPGAYTVQGQIKGATAGLDTVTAALGFNTVTSTTLVPYAMNFLAGAKYDLVAYRRKLATGMTDKFYIERNIQLSGNSTHSIDFNDDLHSGNAERYTVSAPDITDGSVMLRTVNRTVLTVSESHSFGAPIPYAALPAAQMREGDLYIANLTATSQSGMLTIRQMRRMAFAQPANQNTALPALFGSPGVTAADGNITATWSPYPNALAYNLQCAADAGSQWNVLLSAGWLQANTRHGYTLPALSSLAGWLNAWSPAGGEREWTFDAITSNRPLNEIAVALNGDGYTDGMSIGIAGMGVQQP